MRPAWHCVQTGNSVALTRPVFQRSPDPHREFVPFGPTCIEAEVNVISACKWLSFPSRLLPKQATATASADAMNSPVFAMKTPARVSALLVPKITSSSTPAWEFRSPPRPNSRPTRPEAPNRPPCPSLPTLPAACANTVRLTDLDPFKEPSNGLFRRDKLLHL